MGLCYKIDDEVMIYLGYILVLNVEFLLMYYGFLFKVGFWEFVKLDYYDDDFVYECNCLFVVFFFFMR